MSILQGRVVVVTGASSGIGEACALAFAGKGAKVVLAARRAERLEALVAKIVAMGGEALAVATDVTDEAAVQTLLDNAVERFGVVHVLINNAGIADSTAVYEMSLDLWHRVIDTGREFNIAASIFHPGIVATEIAPGAVKLPEDFAASPEDIAGVIVHMCDLPDHLNFYEGMVVQIDLPFLGRG